MKSRIANLLAVGLLLACGFAKEPKTSPQQFAKEVQALVRSLAKTEYQHTTEINESNRSYLCDCSGFVGYLLKKHFPTAHASLKGEEAPWRKRALAVTFHETFLRSGEEEVPGWNRVRRMIDVLPGDVIAWRKDEIVRGESTGHVVLVVGRPEIEPDGRIRVRIVDSTRRIHSDDTREQGTDGVGEGTMWFGVDDKGEPKAYFVDRDANAGRSTRIAIGRLQVDRASH